MSLSLKDIELYQFRNYYSFELNDIGSFTIFVGPNAIGKTNLIEAIQLITSLNSLKSATLSHLITWGKEQAKVKGSFSNEKRNLTLSLDINKENKKYLLNDKGKKPKDLKGMFPSVIFSPDDLCLIKGSQSIKRKWLDDLGSQLSSNYQVIKRDYEKLLLQKNHLLKDNYSSVLLDSINETLITTGTQLYCYRNSLFNRIIPLIKKYYKIISDSKESIEGTYIPSWETINEEIFQEFNYLKEEARNLFSLHLEKMKTEEKRRGRSLIGPHADKVVFCINKKNVGLYGSQGQQRSLVLSIKLAEVAIIEEFKKQKPILLLDDVMSELDENRRRCLLEFITDDLQTFITTTHLEYFPHSIISNAHTISLAKE